MLLIYMWSVIDAIYTLYFNVTGPGCDIVVFFIIMPRMALGTPT
jgi:hypothetical protein